MTKSKAIRHIGNVAAICDRRVSANLREDLEYVRYKRMGISANDRFRGEAPYRICARCLAKMRGAENRWRRTLGQKPLR